MAQGGQDPPQSVSVSLPDFMLSVQVGGGFAQAPLVQSPETQSPGTRQGRPMAQGGQSPPQSAEVSRPFLVLSVQLGSEQ